MYCISIQTPTMKTQMSVALKSYDDLNNRFMYRFDMIHIPLSLVLTLGWVAK